MMMRRITVATRGKHINKSKTILFCTEDINNYKKRMTERIRNFTQKRNIKENTTVPMNQSVNTSIRQSVSWSVGQSVSK